MNKTFSVSLHEPLEGLGDLPGPPPEDDPDDIDLLFWRYFHGHNRRISVCVGDDCLDAHLDDDIRIMMRDLPTLVRRLEEGKPGSLSFPERGTEIQMTPKGETMLCRVHRWGAKSEEPTVTCDAAQVIAELWRFLHELTRSAVDAGYLDERQAALFLGHELPR
jgi:hypothetical protein